MSPPVRNMRVSWGSSYPMRVGDDVSLRLEGSPTFTTVGALALHEGITDQLDEGCRIYLDIRSSTSKDRFDAGTVGSPTSPPLSITRGDSSVEHISTPGGMLKWRVYVVSPDGHKSAEMREYSTYGAAIIGSENEPMLRIVRNDVGEGQLWEMRFESDAPVVCIHTERVDLHDSLLNQQSDCWLILGSIIDKIFDKLLSEHSDPNGTNIDEHPSSSWQWRWVSAADNKFECPLPTISGHLDEDIHALHTWKQKVIERIAARVDYNSKYDNPEDDEQ